TWSVQTPILQPASYNVLYGQLGKVRRNSFVMPEQETIERTHEDAREGKSPSTQAGEFVREEMEHIREGKHGARSSKQAIAIGLSKARRAGVKLAAPKAGKASSQTRKQATRDLEQGRSGACSPRLHPGAAARAAR